MVKALATLVIWKAGTKTVMPVVRQNTIKIPDAPMRAMIAGSSRPKRQIVKAPTKDAPKMPRQKTMVHISKGSSRVNTPPDDQAMVASVTSAMP